MPKPLVFCLMGPTASGKTALACELLTHFPLELISVDSAMIYREMQIGTAKPDAETLARAPHHLIDILDPTESYSAARFCEDVKRSIESILHKGRFPLLVGGTMMYFKALQEGLSSLPDADESLREQLLQEAKERGWPAMHQELAQVDKRSAERIHPHDSQRIQRALEVYRQSQKPLSEYLQIEKEASPYHFVNFILEPEERAWLHRGIALRFEQMLERGFIEEVEALLKNWSLTAAHPSMRTVGYRQVIPFLKGDYDSNTLCEKGIAATRQLAKRQLTWLRHWSSAHTVYAENPVLALREIMAIMKQILDNPEHHS